MKLLELTVQGFLGAPDGAYSFSGPNSSSGPGPAHDLVLITGGPASGKTSLLKAIVAAKQAAGAYGPPPDLARLRRSGATTGRIAATWALTPAEAESARLATATLTTDVTLDDGPIPLLDHGTRSLFTSFTPGPGAGKFELFPADRRIPPAGGPPADLTAARLRLSSDDDKYAGVRAALIDLASRDGLSGASRLAARGVVTRWDQPDSLASMKRSIAQLVPWLRFTGVEPAGAGHAVRFSREDGRDVELDDLSETEKQAVIFAVIFDRVGLSRSIVLIDEPALHVHPEHQPAFLRAIAGLGEGNQIIAATSSAELLASVPASQILRAGKRP